MAGDNFLRKLGYLIRVPTLLGHWLSIFWGAHFLALLACLIGGQSRLCLLRGHSQREAGVPWPVDVRPVELWRPGQGQGHGQPGWGRPLTRHQRPCDQQRLPLSPEGRAHCFLWSKSCLFLQLATGLQHSKPDPCLPRD